MTRPLASRPLALASLLALALGCGSAPAQEAKPGCAPATTAATPPATGPASGTAPGGMGSTAWSGGTGGSYVGTNPQGPTPGSPSAQPDTAKGLDPTKSGAVAQKC